MLFRSKRFIRKRIGNIANQEYVAITGLTKDMPMEVMKKNGATTLVNNLDLIALFFSLGKANKPIQQRMLENLTKADPELGKKVRKGLKL